MQEGVSAADDAVIRPEPLRLLYRYWRGKSVAGQVPDRGAIEPSEIGGRLLPNVMLLDIDDTQRTLRYRLVGSAIARDYGRDFTGNALEQVIHPGQLDWVRELYATARRERRAVYSESRYRLEHGYDRFTYRLYMPLRRGGAEVAMMLAGQIYSEMPATAPPDFGVVVRTGDVVERTQALLP